MKLRKIEWGIIGILLLAFIGIAWAIDESVTVSNTPIGLTSGNYGQSRNALMVVEENAIRFTLDGVTTPTSAGVGIKLEVGQSLTLNNTKHIKDFRAVRTTATDAKLKVTYY